MLSILYKARPDEVKFIMIDPKQVEFTMYNGIPHLLVPVVTDVKQAAGTLMWAVEEMERRYELIETHNVRNLDAYNEKVAANPSIGEKLPKIIIVIDEFADSSFKVLAQELRISEEREDALKPLEININETPDSPKIILGGIIDRVDFFDGEDKRYIRIVDYKTGSHPFSIEALDDGTDVQLPAYLFTAALEKNKEIIGGEKEIFPASALFLSANESAGKVTPERSGFMLDDIELLRAASGELDKKILAGIDVDKSTGTVKKRNAVSEEEIHEIDRSLRESIACTGRSIFEGKAPRTPSPDACKFCFLRSGCPVAAKATTY
jgi:ATP-dependent helicase/DNAse subunit B